MIPRHGAQIAGLPDVPVYAANTIVIGSGAAGLNCAEQLHRLGERSLAVVTERLGAGTSNNSGSDKQTYYKLGIFGDVPDSPMELARTLFQGGMCHGDIAYVEALGSAPAFFHLVENGVQFPFNSYGAYVGYKTDHDPRQRATSAGPKTSMQMFAASLKKCRQAEMAIFDGYEIIRLLTAGNGDDKRVIGALALNKERLGEADRGLTVFAANNIVLATGGPGELFATSVYPPGQVGSHGLALDIGAWASNMAEFQFGLASTGFRWNLSGSYQQVVPCYFSTDAGGGDVRYFLNDYYQTMAQVATNTFLKGYQWPFHAERLQAFGSSLVDIAVHEECSQGRRVYMDLSRNPVAGEGMNEFSLAELSEEARGYLERSGATAETPYERLQQLNPPAIEIYAEHGVDLREPVEVAVCAQHCNGGLTVNTRWETTVRHLFAIGEVAGTHGVRPGGSALNAGQVGGRRAAQYIAARYKAEAPDISMWLPEASTQIEAEVKRLEKLLDTRGGRVGEVRRSLQETMDRAAGIIRKLRDARDGARDVGKLHAELAGQEQRLSGPAQLQAAYQNEHLTLTGLVVLKTIEDLIARGGGSRGAYMVVDRSGDRLVVTKNGDRLPHRSENLEMRREIVEARWTGKTVETKVTPVRPLPDDASWYETTWHKWRAGEIYDD